MTSTIFVKVLIRSRARLILKGDLFKDFERLKIGDILWALTNRTLPNFVEHINQDTAKETYKTEWVKKNIRSPVQGSWFFHALNRSDSSSVPYEVSWGIIAHSSAPIALNLVAMKHRNKMFKKQGIYI